MAERAKLAANENDNEDENQVNVQLDHLPCTIDTAACDDGNFSSPKSSQEGVAFPFGRRTRFQTKCGVIFFLFVFSTRYACNAPALWAPTTPSCKALHSPLSARLGI